MKATTDNQVEIIAAQHDGQPATLRVVRPANDYRRTERLMRDSGYSRIGVQFLFNFKVR